MPGRLLVLATAFALLTAGSADAAVTARADFNGDGRSDLAVGAPDDSVGGEDLAGAVNVIYGSRSGLHEENDQQFTQDTPGVPDAAERGDRFGSSLAAGDIDGDGFSDLAIGAPTDDVPTGVGPGERDRADAGLVLVLYGSGGGLTTRGAQIWTQDVPGIKGRTEANDRFGQALAIGDFDRDGEDDLSIGVPGDSVGGSADAGAVNVLHGARGGIVERRDQLWTQNTRGIKGVAQPGDHFGQAVAAVDVSRNNHAELIIGVPGEDVGGDADAGAVNVIYARDNGLREDPDELWTQDSPGIKGVAERNDRFGEALAVGDFDGDRANDLAVGAPTDSVDNAAGAGSVNVIFGSNSGLREDADERWTQNSRGIKSRASIGDRFGSALSAQDFSRNGVEDLAIGVPGESFGEALEAGAVNVLYGNPEAGLGERADQFWFQGDGLEGQLEGGDLVGQAVTSGDFDGNGIADLGIGAPGDSVEGRRDAGAVNVLYGTDRGLGTSRGDLWTQGTRGIKGAVGPDRFGAALPGSAGAVRDAGARNCGDVAFRPNTDAGAFGIEAVGVDCGTARDVAAAAEGEQGGDYTAAGFQCTGERHSGALPTVRYTCRRDGARITFSVS